MRIKPRHIVIAALTASAALIAYSPNGHIAPDNLYPNSQYGTGLIATTNLADLTQTSACGTYSKCHRNTSSAQKDAVRAEYPHCPSAPNSEIDHIVPLALGGADDVANLWCQPLENDWNGTNYGFKVKDQLEAYLAIQVKGGGITPKDAQTCILNDWVACYKKYFSGQKYGSLPQSDPDEN